MLLRHTVACGAALTSAVSAHAQTITWFVPEGASPGNAIARFDDAGPIDELAPLSPSSAYTDIASAAIGGVSARNQLNLDPDNASLEWNLQIPALEQYTYASVGWMLNFTVDQDAIFTLAGTYQVLVDGLLAEPGNGGGAFTFLFELVRDDETLASFHHSNTPTGDVSEIVAASGSLVAGAEYQLRALIEIEQPYGWDLGALETFGVLGLRVVPAPTSAALLAVGSLLAARRRR